MGFLCGYGYKISLLNFELTIFIIISEIVWIMIFYYIEDYLCWLKIRVVEKWIDEFFL